MAAVDLGPDGYVEYAVDLTLEGWPVLQLAARSKVPLIPAASGGHGHLDATTDPVEARHRWTESPFANIGGRVPDNMVVIDVDPRNGGNESLAALEATYGLLPPTLTSNTGGGGVHLFFEYPAGLVTRHTLGAGLDVKVGGRGYVVLPPSIHPNGHPYQWAEPRQGVAALPATIANLLTSAGKPAPQVGRVDCKPRPGDLYNATVSWQAVLEPAGWVYLGERNGMGYWRRPGKTEGHSATTNALGTDHLHVFTSATVFEAGSSHDKFGAYAVLNHGGDHRSAAIAITTAGWGQHPALAADGTARASEPREGEDEEERRVVGRTASSISPAPVRWAWADRVPLAASTLLAGREGMGKGVLAADLTARWSRGELDGDLCGQPVNVAIMSIEDDPERVLVPRLMAAGADLDRCYLLTASLDGVASQLALPDDVPRLQAWLRTSGARVLIVDVPNSFMAGGFDSHKDHDVRRAVAGPLTLLASALDLAVVLIVHLNRAPSTVVLDRIAGSLGLSRASRAVLAVVENPDEESERLLVLAKSNLGKVEVPSLRFRIDGAVVDTATGPTSAGSIIHLGEAPMVTARNALQGVETEDRTARAEAEEWLAEVLALGPVPAAKIKADAIQAGIAQATVRRAKSALGVKSRRWGRPGAEGGWCWALPEGVHEMPTPKQGAPSQMLEHLRGHPLGGLRP